MKRLKKNRFDNIEEKKINDLVSVTGGYSGKDTFVSEESGTGSLLVIDHSLDRTHIGKGPTG